EHLVRQLAIPEAGLQRLPVSLGQLRRLVDVDDVVLGGHDLAGLVHADHKNDGAVRVAKLGRVEAVAAERRHANPLGLDLVDVGVQGAGLEVFQHLAHHENADAGERSRRQVELGHGGHRLAGTGRPDRDHFGIGGKEEFPVAPDRLEQDVSRALGNSDHYCSPFGMMTPASSSSETPMIWYRVTSMSICCFSGRSRPRSLACCANACMTTSALRVLPCSASGRWAPLMALYWASCKPTRSSVLFSADFCHRLMRTWMSRLMVDWSTPRRDAISSCVVSDRTIGASRTSRSSRAARSLTLAPLRAIYAPLLCGWCGGPAQALPPGRADEASLWAV